MQVGKGPPARDGQYDGHHHVGVLAVWHDAVWVLVDRVVVNIHVVVVTTTDLMFTPVIFHILELLVIDVIVDISDCIECQEDEGHEVERIEPEVADTSRAALSLGRDR